MSRVETSAKQTGLHIHNSKTDYIKFNQGEGDLKALNFESVRQIGLHIHNSKTEYIKFNQGEGELKALNFECVRKVDDFLYLESWINCCSKHVNVRIGKVWSALQKLDTVWKSELSDGLKIGFFRAMVELVLLYESTAWTQSLDGWTRYIQNS